LLARLIEIELAGVTDFATSACASSAVLRDVALVAGLHDHQAEAG
jgi:hypothetical protein